MTIFTYSRVSTLDQNTNVQMEALKTAYPDAIHRQEKKSGTTTKGREVLNLILDMISQGDKLVTWLNTSERPFSLIIYMLEMIGNITFGVKMHRKTPE